MRKVDIPDDLAIAIEEVKESYGLRTFTAAVHLVLKRGCPLVLNGAAVPPQPIASKPATPPELTPVPKPKTTDTRGAIASVTSLPERSASRADRLKRL